MAVKLRPQKMAASKAQTTDTPRRMRYFQANLKARRKFFMRQSVDKRPPVVAHKRAGEQVGVGWRETIKRHRWFRARFRYFASDTQIISSSLRTNRQRLA